MPSPKTKHPWVEIVKDAKLEIALDKQGYNIPREFHEQMEQKVAKLLGDNEQAIKQNFVHLANCPKCRKAMMSLDG